MEKLKTYLSRSRLSLRKQKHRIMDKMIISASFWWPKTILLKLKLLINNNKYINWEGIVFLFVFGFYVTFVYVIVKILWQSSKKSKNINLPHTTKKEIALVHLLKVLDSKDTNLRETCLKALT